MNDYTGHTPGPWTPHFQPIDRGPSKGKEVLTDITGIKNGKKLPVIFPNWNTHDGDVWQVWITCSEADARLIADAPTLLKQRDALREALIKCEDALCRIGQITDETRVGWAIKSASEALAQCDDQT